MLKILNYILAIIITLIMLLLIEISTPLGSLIFEFQKYTIQGWIFQILFISITIGIGIELGNWINNH